MYSFSENGVGCLPLYPHSLGYMRGI
uniref:Uncharacterized protein n=1 Tax=Anguilla anguilla TaxID=7936 RepID=A0A0E9SJM3_ANGAN